MEELDNVYQSLKAAKLCKSKYAFSRDYLGRAPNYYSAIRATNTQPSTHALMTLYFRLSGLSERMDESNHTLKINLSSLSSKVFEDIWLRCQHSSTDLII